MTEEPFTLLPDGRYEHKLLVDRKKLEGMIKECHDSFTSSAAHFFSDVAAKTGAEVLWPSQLKLGAKTKKDPHVKLVGSLGEIHLAKSHILELLQVRKERVSLKMDLHHSLHSHMIGKSGRQIQQVMNLTECHIHFPDSNKFFRENEKSDQVSISGSPGQVLVARSRLKMLYPITMKIEVPWELPTRPELPLLPLPSTLMLNQLRTNLYSIVVRAQSTNDEYLILIMKSVADSLYMPISSLFTQTDVFVGMDTLAVVLQNLLTLTTEMVSIEVVEEEQKLRLSGPALDVLRIRSAVLSLAPVTMQFTLPDWAMKANIPSIEADCRVNIQVKKNVGERFCKLTIKGSEGNFDDVTRARAMIIGNFERKSPDPEDSPLAASILKGAKEYSKNISQRGDLIMKASKAMQQKNTASTRYPTDLWSGYGFSSSLPADLLKGMMDFSPSNSSDVHSYEEEPNERLNGNRALCALREDDELSDFASSRGSFAPPVFSLMEQPRTAFSASTSLFDSSPLGSDFVWDINVFTDPTMVLARLGCSEYVTQLREQEIDMHAFLLLDEQNLKDVGVSTIGARKKIHHAILKLRESARIRGFNI